MSAPDPHFVGSFPRADAPLDPPLPEIAFLGRSNVGKSSLLNALVGRRIAKVSGTPGKTRALNVYQIPTPRSLYFLDLPGYGYARVSKTERAAFAKILRHVLHRPRLAGVVWLLDIRHEPSAGDRTMQDLLAGAGTRVLVAATKSDKLSATQRQRRGTALRETLRLDEDQMVLTSARAGFGLAELRAAIGALAQAA